MLLNLPPELLLSILAYLPLPDLWACILTCKAFKALIDACESAVYRQAAAHPSSQLIPHDELLFSEILPRGLVSNRFLGEAKTWKQFCRRACDVRRSWLGKGPSRTKSLYNEYPPNVHRIKVDEERGFFITTYGSQAIFQFFIPNPNSGRLVVADINNGTPMWIMDSPRIRPHAHCEYAEGFLVFDRYDSMKEIWRLVSDDPVMRAPAPCEVVPESQPDERQLSWQHIYSAPGSRFRFVPHALIRPIEGIHTSAYRLAFPTLLSAASECLFLWDVRTGRLLERMDDTEFQVPASHGIQSAAPYNSGNLLDGVRYVDVNDKYAFVCGKRCIKVFQRRPLPEPATTTTQPVSSEDSQTAYCAMAVFQSNLRLRGRWLYTVKYVEEEELLVESPGIGPPKLENNALISMDDLQDESSDANSDGWVTENDEEEGGEPGNKQIYLAPGRWRHPEKVVVKHRVEMSMASDTSSQLVSYTSNQTCVAVHVSPCGKHLAILGPRGRLMIIPYFERIITQCIEDVNDIMIDIRLNALSSSSESIYLAYEHGRIAVVTSWGLYIIHPTIPAPDDFATAPQIHIQRVATLNNPNFLLEVSCLQMTSTAIWLNWHVELTSTGSVSSDYETQIKCEDGYRKGKEYYDNNARSSTVVSVDFGLGS